MHVEYVIPGIPVSNQNETPKLATWKQTVVAAAQAAWTGPPIGGSLRVVLVNFHTAEKPAVDLDNMYKPILDRMQGVIYDDDRQIRQAELLHVWIYTPLVLPGLSTPIVKEIQAGSDFVYVWVGDAAAPPLLPEVP